MPEEEVSVDGNELIGRWLRGRNYRWGHGWLSEHEAQAGARVGCFALEQSARTVAQGKWIRAESGVLKIMVGQEGEEDERLVAGLASPRLYARPEQSGDPPQNPPKTRPPQPWAGLKYGAPRTPLGLRDRPALRR